MKKIILSALAIASLQLAIAQDAAKTQASGQTQQQTLSPEQKATRQATHLQSVLTLTEDQKQKVYQAVLTRVNALQQAKNASNGDRKALRAQAKPIKEQFVKDVNATLTPEQQQKWEAYRLEQKQKQEQRKTSKNGTPAVNGTTPAPAKLQPQDDGINDN